ncbi:hypothetical protein ANTQUA_LOCUS661 [Anthophora quadrimaculata]
MTYNHRDKMLKYSSMSVALTVVPRSSFNIDLEPRRNSSKWKTSYGRHETSYYCDTCPDKPRMHLGQCFIKYHTQRNYRT